MSRRTYHLALRVNNKQIKTVVIDSHYEKKHSESITDKVILKLVELLDGGSFPVERKSGAFEYFVTDGLELNGKFYKLVWLLEEDQIYIGVINAYRRKGYGIPKRKRAKKS